MLSLLLAFLLLLPTLPVTAGDGQSEPQASPGVPERWTFFTDGFGGYPVGEDTFWKADTVNYTSFQDGHHVNSWYGVAADPEGQHLRLKTAQNSKRAFFVVNHSVTGEYASQFDYRFEQDDPGQHIAVNLFEGYTFPNGPSGPGGTILLYIKSATAYVTDNTSGTAKNYSFTGGQGGAFASAANQWYTVKLTYKSNQLIVKIWPKGEAEPAGDASAGVVTVPSENLNTAVYNAAKKTRIHYLYDAASLPTNRVRCADIDNLSLHKDVTPVLSDASVTLNDDRPSHQLTLSTGGELPVPTVRWQSGDPQVASVSATGLVQGKSEGTTVVTAALLDVRGEDTTVTRSCQVTVEPLTVPVTPERWEFFTDDFTGYPAGEDAFWKADTVNYTDFQDGNHQSSWYGIATDAGSQNPYLRMKVAAKGKRTQFLVNHAVTGGYSVQFDYRFNQSDPDQHIGVNMFQGYTFPQNGIFLYIKPNQAHVNDNTKGTANAVLTYVRVEGGAHFTSAAGQWYTAKLIYRAHELIVKLWPKGEAEPTDDASSGVIRVASDNLTDAGYNASKRPRFHYLYDANPDGRTHYADIGSLSLSKELTPSLSDASVTLSDDRPNHQLTLHTGGELPVPAVRWQSSDPQVATVSSTGRVWGKGPGTAVVTATLLDVRGEPTSITRSCAVRAEALTPVEEPLKVLIVGNSFSRDSLYYVSSLARLYDRRVEPAYLYIGSCTLRMHAKNASSDAAAYTYWTCDAETGVWSSSDNVRMSAALGDKEWDVVTLQQGVAHSGFAGTYNSDLDYLIKYVRANSGGEPPRVLWNMTWANQTGHNYADFNYYYGGVQSWMYNAISRCVNDYILTRPDIEAVVPTGAAIQKARATLGDTLTRDGYHLSTKAGRLIAGLTWLKALFPETDLSSLSAGQLDGILANEYHASQPELDDSYQNTDANLSLVAAAVEEALGEAAGPDPEIRLISEPAQPSHPTELLIGQASHPDLLHFPDAIVVPSTGRVLAASYRNTVHAPTQATLSEGTGDIVLQYSDDNGDSWSALSVLINQQALRDWGIDEGMYSRFERLAVSPGYDYVVVGDPRDPNFAVASVDLDGDGDPEEVVLLTFWVRYITNSGAAFTRLFMMQSTDGGGSWSVPQRITASYQNLLKRGDIAVFSDGELLIPIYSPVKALRMRWDVAQQKWALAAEYAVSPLLTDRSGNLNEISFVSHDGGDTVYAFVRESGEVLVSPDRGASWQHLAYEDRLIHQPGFAVVDEQRIFVTYAQTAAPRSIYGKMFYPAAGWNESDTRLVYASPNTQNHDMGDPSSRLLADGRLLVVYYDTHYRAIMGTLLDPDDFQPMELSDPFPEAVLFSESFENAAAGPYNRDGVTARDAQVVASGGSRSLALEPGGYLTLDEGFTGSATVSLLVQLEDKGELRLQFSQGVGVALTAASLSSLAGGVSTPVSPQGPCLLKATAVGGLVYAKLWPAGETEPANWTLIGGGATDGTDRTIRLTSSGEGRVILDSLTVSRRVRLSISPDTLTGKAGDPPQSLSVSMYPELSGIPVWASDNEAVATVTQEGVVSFVGEGTAAVTVTVQGVSAAFTVTVKPLSPELTGQGVKWPFFSDDFDAYPVGENSFYDAFTASGHYLSQPGNAPSPGGGLRYDIAGDDAGGYLSLQSVNGSAPWFKINTSASGEYTAQFDFSFSGAKPAGGSQFLYITLFQDSDVHAFVHLTPEGVRVQYRETSGGSGTLIETSQLGNEVVYALNTWHTVRIVRVDSGLYVKVWQKDGPEPDEWDVALQHAVLDPGKAATLRMQYYVTGSSPRRVDIDNLTLSKYVRAMEITPSSLSGKPGEQQELSLSFGGMTQDCLPVPGLRWTAVSDAALSLDETGRVTYRSPGTGILSAAATLTDIFGVPTAASFHAALPFTVEEPEPAYLPWEPGQTVRSGDIRSYGDRLYVCLQSHTTQADWTPPAVPALWTAYRIPGEPSRWEQPTGAHDAYHKGDRVIYEGRVFESLLDANVWSPAAYPAGWREIR